MAFNLPYNGIQRRRRHSLAKASSEFPEYAGPLFQLHQGLPLSGENARVGRFVRFPLHQGHFTFTSRIKCTRRSVRKIPTPLASRKSSISRIQCTRRSVRKVNIKFLIFLPKKDVTPYIHMWHPLSRVPLLLRHVKIKSLFAFPWSFQIWFLVCNVDYVIEKRVERGPTHISEHYHTRKICFSIQIGKKTKN